MKFNNIVIEGFDYVLPENILSSDEIEKRLSPLYEKLRLPFGRLELMTGIKERKYWDKGTRPSVIATMAAQKLLDKKNIDKNEIDLIINSSVCRDFLEPSTASIVHNNLKLSERCGFFDLSNACLGVLQSFVVAASMIETGAIKRALIVSGENGGPLLLETIDKLLKDSNINRKNIKKYIANLTIGSAGVAYLISDKSLSPNSPQILGGSMLTDSSASHLCQGDGDSNSLMMETDSEALLKHGVTLAMKTWKEAKKELALENNQFDWVLGHQVGSAHEHLTLKSLGLLKNKTYTTYQTLGNTGSAALPITLVKLSETSQIKSGEHIALLGIGSGLCSIMLGVKWC